MHRNIRILLVDDEVIVREAIAALLEHQPGITVVGEAIDAEMTLHKARALRPDVILLDLRLEKQLSVAVIRTLLHDNPAVRILLLTGYAEDQAVAAAFRAGAVGYVLKTQAVDDLVQAVMNAYKGQSSVPSPIAQIMLQALNQPPSACKALSPLSAAELRVLTCIATGLQNKEIARQLGVSQPTVHGHVARILSKLHLENRTQAALYAVKHRYVSLAGQRTTPLTVLA